MGKGPLEVKSYAFALEIIKVARKLKYNKEDIMSRQILRSGTAIGALISEAQFGQSKMDFKYKMTLALKEANETKFWLDLLYDSGYLEHESYLPLKNVNSELIAMLISTIKTTKGI